MPHSIMISVALIEDNRIVREGLTALLEQADDITVVAADEHGDPDLLAPFSPDVLLLDVGLRDADSLAVAESVRTKLPDTAVILMDLLPAHEDILPFVSAGVRGFVLKDATFDQLTATIRAVAAGVTVLPHEITSGLFTQITSGAVIRDRTVLIDSIRITPREREVIFHIGEGRSNKEIADALNIATHTVKSHVRNVMEKLALHTRLQIAAFARKQGEQHES